MYNADLRKKQINHKTLQFVKEHCLGNNLLRHWKNPEFNQLYFQYKSNVIFPIRNQMKSIKICQ